MVEMPGLAGRKAPMLLPLLAIATAAAADPAACSRDVFAAAARAYRETAALSDTFTYTVQATGSEKEPKTLRLGFAGKNAFVADPGLEAWAVGSRMYVIRPDVPDGYVSAPYSGDFRAALDAIVGTQGSAFEPGPIGLHAGETYEALLVALRFKQLAPLRVVACDRKQREVRFEAGNGTLKVRLDSRTDFFAAMELELRPVGAPEGFAVRIAGTFAPHRGGEIAFAPGTRRPVRTLAELSSPRLAPGTALRSFALETLEGRKLSFAELRGSVVVLDFWATWCVPCWKTLRETQALADWVAQERLPVKVLAVNTLEQQLSVEEKRARAAELWKSQGLSLTSLLDADESAFKACGSPGLPSLIVVGKDGAIAAVHQGLFPDVLATLQTEVRAALR
jgi:thiol-disulfide isomerase/thioredoxin